MLHGYLVVIARGMINANKPMAAACSAAGGKINNVVECSMYISLPAQHSYDCSIQGEEEQRKRNYVNKAHDDD